MKLYATVTSERASKGQGGNEFLDIDVMVRRQTNAGHLDDYLARLTIRQATEGESEIYGMYDSDDNLLAYLPVRLMGDDTKGKKQEGGAICARRDCNVQEHQHSWMR